MAQAGYIAQGDFWFHVAKDGTVEGYAIVAYKPMANLTTGNSLISYAQSISVSFLGAVSTVTGPLTSLTMNDLAGFVAKFPNPMPTKAGPIIGTLETGTLSISWADGRQQRIPVTVYANYINANDETITQTPMVAETPWPGSARVTDRGPRLRAEAQDQNRSKEKEVTEFENTYWGAHKVEYPLQAELRTDPGRD